MAQAALILDNSDGWLPIDFSEVEIGRRAFRSGENEYILNGQKVRLRDVSELLASSGLAERTYTVIGQGLVDAAVGRLRPRGHTRWRTEALGRRGAAAVDRAGLAGGDEHEQGGDEPRHVHLLIRGSGGQAAPV